MLGLALVPMPIRDKEKITDNV